MPGIRIPSSRRYQPKNLGLVVIDGKQHYLGPYGSPESLAGYNPLIQEWLAGGGARSARGKTGDDLSINELILAFWTRFAQQHDRHPDGTPTGELANDRDSLRPLGHGRLETTEIYAEADRDKAMAVMERVG